MKVRQFFSRLGAKTKHNAPLIFAVLASADVVVTMYFTAKGAIKADEIIKDEEKAEGDLTTPEKVKIAAPYYLPAVGLGASTIFLILFGNHISRKQQASLLVAYTLLGDQFREYKQKTIDICGEEKAKEIERNITEDHLRDAAPSENDDIPLWYDQYTGRYFNAPVEQIKDAIYKINRNFALRSYASLGEFLLFCCPEEFHDYPEPGEHKGWEMTEMFDGYDAPGVWIDISWQTIITDDGLQVNYIDYEIPPFDENEDTVGMYEGLAKQVDR